MAQNIQVIHGAAALADRDDVGIEDTIVLIDALRASNTVITLLSCGAKRIDVFSDLSEVREVQSNGTDYVYVGEQNANSIEGFDFNNSPTKILHSRDVVKGKSIAMITTNFAVQLVKLESINCNKLVGSLLNVKALCDYLKGESVRNGNLFLVAAGRNGERAPEDEVTAEVVEKRLNCDGEIDEDRVKEIYLGSASASNLVSKGFSDDIHFCLRAGIMDTVPRIEGRRIESM